MNKIIKNLPKAHDKLQTMIIDYSMYVRDNTITKALYNVLDIMKFMSLGVDIKISYNYEGGVLMPNIDPKMPNDSRDKDVKTYTLVDIKNAVLEIIAMHPSISTKFFSGQELQRHKDDIIALCVETSE